MYVYMRHALTYISTCTYIYEYIYIEVFSQERPRGVSFVVENTTAALCGLEHHFLFALQPVCAHVRTPLGRPSRID